MFVKQLILPGSVARAGPGRGADALRPQRGARRPAEDYLRTARAKGLRRWRRCGGTGCATRRSRWSPCSALQLATLLVGAVVVERVFVIPGLGSLLLDAVGQPRPQVVQDVVMVIVVAVLVINFVVDLLYVRHRPAAPGGPAMSTLPEVGPANEPQPEPAPARRGPRRRPLGATLVVGGVLVALIVLMALVSFVWTPYDPTFVNAADRLQGSSSRHWLGTDKFGRDIFCQILMGARTTLFVGVVAVGVAAVIGVPLGIVAAMASRWTGEALMRGNDLLLAFPALLLAIMFGAIFGGVDARGHGRDRHRHRAELRAAGAQSGSLQVMHTEYVLAARAAGRRPFAIGLQHVLPNVGPA